MDLKSMNSIVWLILFGILAIVPGSTLNATELPAVTATKAETEAETETETEAVAVASTSIEMLSASAVPTIITPNTKTDTLRRNSMVEKNSITLTPKSLSSQEVTMGFKTHSISPTLAAGKSVEADVRAKSSIMSSTKDQRMKDELYTETVQAELAKTFRTTIDTDDYEFAAEFSTTGATKTTERTRQSELPEAKVTRTAASKAFSGGSTQSITKVDVTTKQIKVSLNRTEEIAAKRVGWKAAGEQDKRRIDSIVTKSTTAVTPKAIMTGSNKPTTPATAIEATLVVARNAETTIEALPAAAAQTKLATALFPLTPTAQQNYENIANGIRAHRGQIFSNNKSNYNYDYNQTQFEYQEGDNNSNNNNNNNNSSSSSNADVEDDAQHISSIYQQQRQAQRRAKLPLRRPKVDKYISDNKANDNNYSYNSNNNYYNSQQNAVSSMLVMQQHVQPPRKIRQQHARQVQQQQQQPPTTPPMATPTGVIILSAMESNLISNDMQLKQNGDYFNKSATTTRTKNKIIIPQLTSGGDIMLFTLKPTTSWSQQIEDVVQSVDERETINITTTTASPFPTVSTTTLKSTTRRPTPTTTPRPTPSIDDYQTVISQAGTHAYLPCNVKQLVKKPISWLRVRDGHILTVDQTTFIADQRFQAIFAPNPERWSLQIKYVQLKDEGTYECQVSTEPKSSAIVTLRVVEPKTELIGEPTRHVKAGSQVKLRCIISQALDPPLFINWFHNQKQIYLHSRRGWRTEIERIELPITDAATTTTTAVTTTTTTKTTGTVTKTTVSASTTPMTNLSTTAESEGPTTVNTVADADAAVAYSSTSKTPATATAITMKATLLAERQVDSSSDDSESGDTESAPVMPTVSSPPIGRVKGGGASAVGVADTYGFGTGNATSSLLAAVTAAVVTMSTALPTITKAIYWPTTTITKTTMSTTLAAVEVRQITTASLIIPSVEKQDSGNYTCSPSNSAPKTVIIHVLNGEYSASAITSGVSSNIVILNQFKWSGALLLLSLCQLKFTVNLSLIRILSAVPLIWV